MNPLWLLLIIPAAFVCGVVMTALYWRFDDSDARMIALLKTQYDELQRCSDVDVNLLALRHDRERREIEG